MELQWNDVTQFVFAAGFCSGLAFALVSILIMQKLKEKFK